MFLIENVLTALGENMIMNILDDCTNNIINDVEYRKYFEKAAEYINIREDQVDNFREIFSKENMMAISEGMRLKKNVSMKTYLSNELAGLMNSYDVPSEIADVYINQYICSFCTIIKEKDHDLYMEWELDEVKRDLQFEVERIVHLIEATYKSYIELQNQSIYVYSLSTIDQQLRNNTDNPKIDLNFYTIDDNNFCDKFVAALKNNNEVINVRARCDEEAIYGILNELRKIKEQRPVFVVKDKHDWHKLINHSGEGQIYIPWFYEEECEPIPNNITIFVYNNHEPIFANDYLSLRPRVFSTITKQLEKAGMDYSAANKMVCQSHGLYMLMKRKIFKSRQMRVPSWFQSLPDRVKVVSLLLGSWTEDDGDIAVVEKLSHMTYEEFISKLTPQFNDEDPLVCRRKRNRVINYYISDCVIAWEYLRNYIDDSMWNNFRNELINVMTHYEEYFSISKFERLYADIKGKKPRLSASIRCGMINTLKIGAFLYGRCNQTKLNEIADTIISSINNEKKWIYICDYLQDLFEISPAIMLLSFNNEFENPTGLLNLFPKKQVNILFERRYYDEVLYSIEQLFVQREYANEALNLLIRFNNSNLNDKSGSGPQNYISRILIPSHNLSIYDSTTLKKQVAEKVIEECVNGWEIIYEVLYARMYLLIDFSKPEYRPYDQINKNVLKSDYFELKKFYFQLLVEKSNNDAQCLINLVDKINLESNENRMAIYQCLIHGISKLDDKQKISLQKHIISKVYDHRKYANADWTMCEDEVENWEQLFNDIKMEKCEDQYVYLFDEDMSKVLLNPVHYKDKNNYNLDCKHIDELINSKLSYFKKEKLDLHKLIISCGECGDNTLGKYIARYIDNYHINSTHLQWLYGAEVNKKMAYDYCNEISRKNPDEILELLKNRNLFDDDFIVKLYYIQFTYAKGDCLPAINNAPENIKTKFWKQNMLFMNKNNAWLLHECNKYGSLASYIQTLFFNNQEYALGNKLYDYFILIINMVQDNSVDNRTKYYLTSLLDSIFKMGVVNNDQDINKMVSIELMFYITYGLLEWENMIFYNHLIRRSPDLYVQIISICVNENNESKKENEISSELKNRFIKLLDDMKFCPAEKNGKVSFDELTEWIDRFYILLQEDHIEKFFTTFLGKTFSYAPNGEDDHMPCEAVRRAIEQYGDTNLINEFACSVENSRGVFYVTDGVEEASISKKYKREYEYFGMKYPKTAQIFKKLSDNYLRESLNQREIAENGEF